MHICFQILLQYNLFKMLAVFRCSHRHIICFAGIDHVLSTKSYSTGYNDQIKVVYIFYQAPSSWARMGSDDRSEWDFDSFVNQPASGKLR